MACHASPVFKAAFNSGFIEGQSLTYRLDDVQPEAFKLLAQWMYSRTYDIHWAIDEVDTGMEKNITYEDIEIKELFDKQTDDLVSLWILADRFILPRLQNRVITSLYSLLLINRSNAKVYTGWIPIAFAGTCAGSKLRLFALQYCLWAPESKRGNFFTANPKHFPRELLLELAEHQIKEGKVSLVFADFKVQEE